MEKLTLKFPLSVGKKTIGQLVFRDYATAEDLMAFDEVGQNRQTIALIASLTGTDEELIKRMHVADFRAADAIAAKLISVKNDEKKESESLPPAP